MNSYTECILELIGNKINHKSNVSLEDVELSKLEDILYRNKLLSFVYMDEYIDSEIKGEKTISFFQELSQKLNSLSLMQIISEKKFLHYIEECYKSGLHPIVFKGPVLSRLYDNSYERISCDIDILTEKGEYSLVKDFFINKGFDCCKQKDNVDVLSKDVVRIELHQRLWEDFSGDNIDILEGLNLSESSSLIFVECNDVKVLTLGYTEQLIYYVYHFVKHFILEGTNIRSLVDFTYFINQEYEKIDFIRFWNAMEQLGYTFFISSIFQTCIDHFGMRNLKLAEKVNLKFQEYILEDLLCCGRYNEDDDSHWDLLRYMSVYLCEGKDKSFIKSKLEMIFPKPEQLNEKFAYAKKYPILLGVAYLHRGILYIKKKLSKSKGYYTVDKLKKADFRYELIKKCKLI